jgi:beta-glucosidase
MLRFPKNFLIGAATAAHQVEGNNVHSDFWAMEQIPGSTFKEPSLQCVDHYRRYKEDIDLLAGAGLNAYRFSVEWARIEPEQNRYAKEALLHYRDVLQYCRDKGVTPIVTMHHFTSPKWLIENGGWEDERTVDAFVKYCAYVASELGGLMTYVCTINEANMGLQIAKIAAEQMREVQVGISAGGENPMMAYMSKLAAAFGGMNPRDIHIFLSGRTPEGDLLIMKAHEKARDTMKSICPHLKIGVTLSLFDYQSLPGGETLTEKEREEEFLHYLPFTKKDDFLGLQNYTRKVVGPDGFLPNGEGAELTQMNYEYYPQALEGVIRYTAKHLDIPILVTENGIATADDTRRIEFIKQAMGGVEACIADGIPVAGYIHWSLLDNFEWMLGFGPTFGLIAVDRATQKRYPKKSLNYLGSFSK